MEIRTEEDTDRIERFKAEMNTCPFCNHHLIFKHDYDFLLNRVLEQGECKQCHLKLRHEIHPIQ